MGDHFGSFEENRSELEILLPAKDFLLIHPGVEGQKEVFKYSERFPNLNIAFVIPGDFGAYKERMKGIDLFGYEHAESIVNYVLNTPIKRK